MFCNQNVFAPKSLGSKDLLHRRIFPVNNLLNYVAEPSRKSIAKYEILRPYLDYDFSEFHANRIAQTFQRHIKQTKRHKKETTLFVQDILNKVLYLHKYNLKVAEVTYKYPLFRNFTELLVQYVVLECNVLYKKEFYLSQNEPLVQQRIMRLLNSIYISYFETKGNIPRDKLHKEAAKAILNLIIQVKLELENNLRENNILENIAIKLLKKIGELEKVAALKGKCLPCPTDSYLTDPSIADIYKNVITSDYGTDDDFRNDERDMQIYSSQETIDNDSSDINIEVESLDVIRTADILNWQSVSKPSAKVATICIDDDDDEIIYWGEEVKTSNKSLKWLERKKEMKTILRKKQNEPFSRHIPIEDNTITDTKSDINEALQDLDLDSEDESFNSKRTNITPINVSVSVNSAIAASEIKTSNTNELLGKQNRKAVEEKDILILSSDEDEADDDISGEKEIRLLRDDKNCIVIGNELCRQQKTEKGNYDHTNNRNAPVNTNLEKLNKAIEPNINSYESKVANEERTDNKKVIITISGDKNLNEPASLSLEEPTQGKNTIITPKPPVVLKIGSDSAVTKTISESTHTGLKPIDENKIGEDDVVFIKDTKTDSNTDYQENESDVELISDTCESSSVKDHEASDDATLFIEKEHGTHNENFAVCKKNEKKTKIICNGKQTSNDTSVSVFSETQILHDTIKENDISNERNCSLFIKTDIEHIDQVNIKSSVINETDTKGSPVISDQKGVNTDGKVQVMDAGNITEEQRRNYVDVINVVNETQGTHDVNQEHIDDAKIPKHVIQAFNHSENITDLISNISESNLVNNGKFQSVNAESVNESEKVNEYVTTTVSKNEGIAKTDNETQIVYDIKENCSENKTTYSEISKNETETNEIDEAYVIHANTENCNGGDSIDVICNNTEVQYINASSNIQFHDADGVVITDDIDNKTELIRDSENFEIEDSSDILKSEAVTKKLDVIHFNQDNVKNCTNVDKVIDSKKICITSESQCVITKDNIQIINARNYNEEQGSNDTERKSDLETINDNLTGQEKNYSELHVTLDDKCVTVEAS